MLTDERVDAIFAEMDLYVIELEPDPTSLGPAYFKNLVATCRNYLNKVSLVLNELNREKLSVSSDLRRREASYALASDDLLANDTGVRSLGAIDDRMATVGFMLRDQKIVINGLKDRMHSLESVYKVVNFRNKELHATMTAIKDQSRMMQSEIRSGNFYGDERTGSGVQVDEITEEELALMMMSDTPVPDTDTSVIGTGSGAVGTPSDDEAISEFLGDAPGTHSKNTSDDEDFQALLDGF